MMVTPVLSMLLGWDQGLGFCPVLFLRSAFWLMESAAWSGQGTTWATPAGPQLRLPVTARGDGTYWS